jgi:hypothetical protein
MIITAAKRFHAGLLPREKANYSLEDIISELWILVRKKDEKWDPLSGAYTTFAMLVMKHHFDDLRSACRTVHAPRNSYSRIRALEGAGSDSKILGDIRRSMREPLPLRSDCDKECPSAFDEACRKEEYEAANSATEDAIPDLVETIGTRGAMLVSLVLGVGDNNPRTIEDAAAVLGMTMAEANRVASKGQFYVAEALASE